MKPRFNALRPAGWPGRIRGMFNLNDPRGGAATARQRGRTCAPGRSARLAHPAARRNPARQRLQPGPPDLDELWRDFNRKLSGLLGGWRQWWRRRWQRRGGTAAGRLQPDMKRRAGHRPDCGVAVLIWLGTGFFIVQEGQQAVITQFGKYKSTVGAGFNWRLPYPFQRHELVRVTQIRSVDVGRDTSSRHRPARVGHADEDENIVEIKFAVQYRLSDARAWLFESKNPDEAVVQVAETAVREVVGKMKMDTPGRRARPDRRACARLMQAILDRYKVGVEVVGINMQQGGVRPPEQVQAAFDDVLKAGQERERAKNEPRPMPTTWCRAPWYRRAPEGRGQGYKARVVAQAQGDAQRFVRADRVPEGAAGHARPHVHRRDAADLQQRDQGPGQPRRLQPAVPAAGQDDAGRRQPRAQRAQRQRRRRQRARRHAGPPPTPAAGRPQPRQRAAVRGFR
jgi:membrane protease subunit HflK